MSGFQIMITPTRIRNARKASVAREPTDCIMAPFSAKAVVTFEDIPVTKTARRLLNVHNPTNLPLQVSLTRILDPSLGLQGCWTSVELPPESSVPMELSWTPAEVVSYRGSMQFTDQRNFKKDVLFVMRSIDKSGKGAAGATAQPAQSGRTGNSTSVVLVPKPPKGAQKSPTTGKPRRSVAPTSKAPTSVAPPRAKLAQFPKASARNAPVEILGHHNQAAALNFAPQPPNAGKENHPSRGASPPAQRHRFDTLFDQLQFTPDIAAGANRRPSHLEDQQTPGADAAAAAARSVPLWQLSTPQDAVVPRQPSPQFEPAAAAAVAATNAGNLFSPSVFSTARRSVSPQDGEMLRRQLFAAELAANSAGAAASRPQLCPPGKQFQFQMSPDKCYPLLRSPTPATSPATPKGSSPQLGGASPASLRTPGSAGQRLLSPLSAMAAAAATAAAAAAGAGQPQRGLAVIREEANAVPPLADDDWATAALGTSQCEVPATQKTYNISEAASATMEAASSPGSQASSRYASAQSLGAAAEAVEMRATGPKTPLSKNFASMQNLHGGGRGGGAVGGGVDGMGRAVGGGGGGGGGGGCGGRAAMVAGLWSAQGSMPNLTDMERGVARPIESNRYFYQRQEMEQMQLQQQQQQMMAARGGVGGHEINFRETEIAAQSSRLNLTHYGAATECSGSLAFGCGGETYVIESATAIGSVSSGASVTSNVDGFAATSRTFAIPTTSAAASKRPHQPHHPSPVTRHQPLPSVGGPITRTPLSASAPRLTLTSPTPPRGGVVSGQPKRTRDETHEKSLRKSFKHSPPKRQRQQSQQQPPPSLFEASSSVGGSSLNSSLSSLRSAKSTSSLAKGETTHRLSGWGGCKPKQRLGSQTSRSVVSLVSASMRQPRQEVAVPLFDADMHIQTRINPDAFAASTTCDPFLAATMYLDQQCIDRHQAEFKKWLNALVTIPDDLQASNAPQPQSLDFGALFQNVRHRDVSVAQTKEVVSANHFTRYRLDGLRRAAIALYTSDEMRVPLEKLVVQIERKQIAIKDRDLHVDVVLQRQVLELLLSFNLLWLRLGLEITFGEQILMRHNGDLHTLSVFMVRRLFRDRYLDERTSALQKRHDDYAEAQRKYALKKILTLFVFLDMAKRKRIVAHNPCLFAIGSEHKEMRSVLQRFASSYCANLGDIQKELRRIGIVLSHRQCYLDEFDYAFRNLAVDLRDGVRLSRVMEILLLRNDLMDTLRVPAISRLQRVHNVEVALRAWREADFALSGGITGADIADGHREKTLSLLWQLIYKFRSPKFTAAAVALQRWWRSRWLAVLVARRIRAKWERRRTEAAVVLQAAWRGRRERREARAYVARRTTAATILQAYTRRWLVLRRLHVQNSCAVYIQRWWRATRAMHEDRERFERLHAAALFVQRVWRRRRFALRLERAAQCMADWRLEARRRETAAVVLQRRWQAALQMRRQQAEVQRARGAAMRVQSWWRAQRAGQAARAEYQRQRAAALVLQRHWRARRLAQLVRGDWQRWRTAASRIQARWRARRAMLEQRASFGRQREAAVVLQRRFRARSAMREQRAAYQKLQHSVSVVQQRFRANRLARVQRTKYAQLKAATSGIQSRWRAQRDMRSQRSRFQQLRSAVICVQQRWRALRQMRQQRAEFRQLRDASCTLQSRFRAQLQMRTARVQFELLRNSVLCIQRRFRANRAAQQQRAMYQRQREASVCIQGRFRALKAGQLQRQLFLTQRSACVTIQSRFRAMCAMRQQRSQFIALRSQAIRIQRQFRANRQCRDERTRFAALRQAAVCIQRRWRARQLSRLQLADYQRVVRACRTIQQHWRARRAGQVAREQFTTLRHSAICVQQRYRALVAGRHQRRQFQLLKSSAICVQRRFRALLAMRTQRAAYQRQLAAATTIQQRFRALVSRRSALQRFTALRRSAIHIQRIFRAKRAGRAQRALFQRQRNAAICLQRAFRGLQAMRNQRHEYQQLRAATIRIQRRLRATLAMRQQRRLFLQQRLLRAAVCVQRRFRAQRLGRQQQSSYQALRAAAITIQQRFRARCAGRLQRAQFQQLRWACSWTQTHYRAKVAAIAQHTVYLELKLAVLSVQRRFRAQRQARQVRTGFVQLRAAVVCVQQRWRATLEGRQCVAQYRAQREAAVCIQRRWRAICAMRQQRTAYLRERAAIVVVQQRFRAQLAARAQRSAFQRLRAATVAVQRRWRGRREQHEVRQQFLLIRSLCVCVQRKWRAHQAMLVQRASFERLRAAAVCVQRLWRRRQQARHQRAGFLRLRRIALGLQSAARGWMARRRLEAGRPQLVEQRRRLEAVLRCQRVWRGLVVRRRTSRKVAVIRGRLAEAASRAEPHQRLGYWVRSAVSLLNGRTNAVEVLRILLRLVKVSRETPQVLIADAEFICNFCYGIMAQAIRSEVDKQKIELCSCVILNLSRFAGTKEAALQSHGLVTVAQMLLRWCDKECGIFNTLCSVIYVQVQCGRMRNIIYNYMTGQDAIFMLRETKKMVIRKERMRANRAANPLQPPLTAQQRVQLPMLLPDFGLRSTVAHVFNCSVFGFDTILEALGIRV